MIFEASSFPRKLEESPFWRKKKIDHTQVCLMERAQAGGKFPEPAQLLFGCSANQSNEGWHGQTVQNPCKSYSSSAYIDVGTVRIAFLWRKTVQNELLLQGVHTCTDCSNSIFVAQNRAKRAILTGRTYMYTLEE